MLVALPQGVQRERLPHHLLVRCSVLHCYTADIKKQEFFNIVLAVIEGQSSEIICKHVCGVAVFLAVGNKSVFLYKSFILVNSYS